MAGDGDATNPNAAEHMTTAICLLILPSPLRNGAFYGSSLRKYSKGFARLDTIPPNDDCDFDLECSYLSPTDRARLDIRGASIHVNSILNNSDGCFNHEIVLILVRREWR